MALRDAACRLFREGAKAKTQGELYDADVPGIGAGSETDDYVTFDVGSGSYLFKLNGRT